MICRSCLRRASSLSIPSTFSRTFTTRGASLLSPTAEPSTQTTPPFSTPLTPPPSLDSLGLDSKPKIAQRAQIPVSSCPAGTVMKGLNYFKGKDDLVALKEEEYPEWLWRCLDVKEKEDDKGANAGDEFAKSKKLRRKAAKAQRKLEAKLLASGDLSALQPKIPITKQSIDLPANDEGTVEGALKAAEKRAELRGAMREERRAKIKETNYLKSM